MELNLNWENKDYLCLNTAEATLIHIRCSIFTDAIIP